MLKNLMTNRLLKTIEAQRQRVILLDEPAVLIKYRIWGQITGKSVSTLVGRLA